MEHPYGQFDSWTIVDDNTAVKKTDKSFFEYRGSGVPAEIRWFFDAEDMKVGDKKHIQIQFEDDLYKGHLGCEKPEPGRIRIFWEPKLKAQLDYYYTENKNFPDARFEKLGAEKYRLIMDVPSPKYQVNTAVWVAAAMLAMEVYDKDNSAPLSSYYFTQAQIVKRAQTISEKDVNGARCSSHCCADSKGHNCNYLRGDLAGAPSYRRLTKFNEFTDKTHPEALDNDDMLCVNGRMVTMEELLYFVEYQYAGVEDDITVETKAYEKYVPDKNMILYGPPGTGKTYHTAIYAVAICDQLPLEEVQSREYSEVMDRYRQLQAAGRVAFTTFHQSYGYEEFIEGIKPVVDENSAELSYTIEPGVFKRFCERASAPEAVKDNPDASIWFVRLAADGREDNKEHCFQNGELRFDLPKYHGQEKDQWFTGNFVEKMQVGDYVLSYADSSVNIDAVGIIESEAIYEEQLVNARWRRKIRWTVLPEKVDVREINSGKYLPNFYIARMNHMKLADLLSLFPEENYHTDTTEKPYVFIIDEINRGNISKIFGELITLIEDTKRGGMEEEASAILPYSGETFCVPGNVYILGTMNTADRSIALMDTALRRRFQFVEMMPDSQVLVQIGADRVEDLDVAKMLDTINERITFLYDREHTIGHAFFTRLAKEPTVKCLASIFRKSVIPLLQEYFYEDYQKIQLVLGDNGKEEDSRKFILDQPIQIRSVFKGDADDVIDLPERKYSINDAAFENIESYKEIL